jgi:hypothetical protein
VALLVGIAGCGGGIDKGKLEDAMTNDLKERFPTESIIGVHCDQRGDAYHFDCTGSTESGKLIYLRANCDKSQGGTCTWRITRRS